ncbi:Fluconazole resistance protein 3 [Colletotrichum sidae]|uniref:Fluconazole resistance protein 3 n=2 Tax=Colletotrichum orbiculare species complex TaxID=2707354 RepID=A0A4V3HS36_9PEZI|nr:Fluconazole resistance protein 3 [Colletotrichum spinosum]TEA20178.1 Fluconazole resistance protein 3 [Colletotrichum sidae]
MDFSHQYFAQAQPYQFMGIPPLTPSHSNSAGSDDFNTTSPPQPDVYAEYPSDQHFGAFDNYAAAAPFNPHHAASFPGPPGPPTPPNHGLPVQPTSQPQRHNAMSPPMIQQIKPQPQPQPLPQSADLIIQRQDLDDHSRRGGSNSDDEDLTPAQSRRKAQNRAAQRAFRERKERHVKDLEAKLANLEAEAQQKSTENERLKREMQKISTENEILRATSSMNGHGSSTSPEPRTTGPMHYNPKDFYSDLLAPHNNKTPSHRVAISSEGERLLAAGATWDLIINHPLFKRGLVDVGDVSERLKHQARCDGQGPVFSERCILDAIEGSVASGSDELL